MPITGEFGSSRLEDHGLQGLEGRRELADEGQADERRRHADRQHDGEAGHQGGDVRVLDALADPPVDRAERRGEDEAPQQHPNEGLQHQPAEVEGERDSAQEDEPADLLALVFGSFVHGITSSAAVRRNSHRPVIQIGRTGTS
ncbi:hypothetical protein [Nannocystis pusilla]|uniref:hypothetical protein n=1 Tax=Nannocystis pusilla TaxID=889268 RepID=UPI003DA62CC2